MGKGRTWVMGLLATATAFAHGDEIDGVIQAVDLDRKTFIIDGRTFHVTADTAFEDGLGGFIDLVRGLRVEVDYVIEDGRYVVTEVEAGD